MTVEERIRELPCVEWAKARTDLFLGTQRDNMRAAGYEITRAGVVRRG